MVHIAHITFLSKYYLGTYYVVVRKVLLKVSTITLLFYRRHLLHRGFRSTALLALVDQLDCAAICSQSPNCTDGDSKGLELAVSKLRDYPLEPVHSFLRIAQFRWAAASNFFF